VIRQADLPTAGWRNGAATKALRRFVVDPSQRRHALQRRAARHTKSEARCQSPLEFVCARTHAETLRGVGIDYPKPNTIGPDGWPMPWRRSIALAHSGRGGFWHGGDVRRVDRRGNYVGGIIAPGLAAMTDYLHEKTALLPRIRFAK